MIPTERKTCKKQKQTNIKLNHLATLMNGELFYKTRGTGLRLRLSGLEPPVPCIKAGVLQLEPQCFYKSQNIVGKYSRNLDRCNLYQH